MLVNNSNKSINFVDFVSYFISISKEEPIKEKLSTVLKMYKEQKDDLQVLEAICEPNRWGKIFQIR